MGLAGIPTAVQSAGIDFATTAPAPIIEFEPIVKLFIIFAPVPT